jgi:hypothetical protein
MTTTIGQQFRPQVRATTHDSGSEACDFNGYDDDRCHNEPTHYAVCPSCNSLENLCSEHVSEIKEGVYYYPNLRFNKACSHEVPVRRVSFIPRW